MPRNLRPVAKEFTPVKSHRGLEARKTATPITSQPAKLPWSKIHLQGNPRTANSQQKPSMESKSQKVGTNAQPKEDFPDLARKSVSQVTAPNSVPTDIMHGIIKSQKDVNPPADSQANWLQRTLEINQQIEQFLDDRTAKLHGIDDLFQVATRNLNQRIESLTREVQAEREARRKAEETMKILAEIVDVHGRKVLGQQWEMRRTILGAELDELVWLT